MLPFSNSHKSHQECWKYQLYKLKNLIDRMQNASVCASSLVIAGEYVTRSQVFLMQRWPFTTFPLTFYVKHDWAGFFSQESLWFLLTSCFKWEDLFILSWTISFLLEWMKSWIRRDYHFFCVIISGHWTLYGSMVWILFVKRGKTKYFLLAEF